MKIAVEARELSRWPRCFHLIDKKCDYDFNRIADRVSSDSVVSKLCL